MTKRVLVPLAQSCEELEAVTIIDLLVRAGIEVVTASLDDEKVIRASRGVRLIADFTFKEVAEQDFEMIVLPGGMPGADFLEQSSGLRQLILKVYQQQGLIAAICAAPKVLAKIGLLDGKTATSYPGFLDQNPANGMTYSSESVVEDGRVITSRGPGTAMDFALALIEKLLGSAKRLEVEKGLVRP